MGEWILSSCVLILVVVGLRALLKDRISQRLRYGLWALVLVRLLVPFHFFESDLSIQNTAPAQAVAQVQTRVEAPITYVDYELPEIEVPVVDVNLPQEEQQVKFEQEMADYNEAIEQAKVETGRPITLSQVLMAIWVAGMAVTGVILLVCNLRFGWQLHKDREKTEIACSLPVYLTRVVSTPCLFGGLTPAIYLPAGDEKSPSLSHVLAHETGHYKQLDHVWSVLRCLCLCLHWYNPLVWLAAALSKKDAELSCDEATIKALGEDQRLAYGRTLIEMTCAKREAKDLLLTATTMNLGKRTLKERVTMIAKHPRTAVYTLVALILVMALAVGCTFSSYGDTPTEPDPPETTTGPVEENTVPDDTTAPDETTAPDDTTVPVTTAPPLDAAYIDGTEPQLLYNGVLYKVYSSFESEKIYEDLDYACNVTETIELYLKPGTHDIWVYTFDSANQIVTRWRNAEAFSLADNPMAYFQDLLYWDIDNRWYNQAMTCIYASPEDLDFYEFFFCGFPDESSQRTPEEDAFLTPLIGEAETDLCRLPTSKINAILQQYFGISSLNETKQKGLEIFHYWPEKDCYYYERGDSNGISDFTVTNVVIAGDGSYQVYYYSDESALDPSGSYVITLVPNGDGYLIRSNLPA